MMRVFLVVLELLVYFELSCSLIMWFFMILLLVV